MKISLIDLKNTIEAMQPKSTYVNFGIHTLEYQIAKRRLIVSTEHYKSSIPKIEFTFNGVIGYSLIQENFFQEEYFEWFGILGVSKRSNFTSFIAPEKSLPSGMLNFHSYRLTTQNEIIDIVCSDEVIMNS